MCALSRYSLVVVLSLLVSAASYAQDTDSEQNNTNPVEIVAGDVADTDKVVNDGAEISPDATKDHINATLDEVIDRQASEENAEAWQRKAVTAYQEQEFDKAVDYYLKALEILQNQDVTIEEAAAQSSKIEKVKKLIGQSYFCWAEKTFMEAEEFAELGEYDKAIEFCRQALEYFPQAKDKAEVMISKYERMKSSAEYRKETSEDELIPDARSRDKRLALLLRQGQVLVQTQQWAKAMEKYNEVLVIDPYNITAIDALRRVYLKQLDAGHRRRSAVVLERHAEALWGMVAPIVTHTQAAQEADTEETITKIDLAGTTQKKLNEITLERIDFDEVSISQVVQFLKHTSKDKDPDHVGVNFVLRFNTDNTSSINNTSTIESSGEGDEEGVIEEYESEEGNNNIVVPANYGMQNNQEEGNDNEGEDVFGGDEEGNNEFGDGHITLDEEGNQVVRQTEDTPVTLSVENVSLYNAIRYICKSANLHFRVEDYAVVIAAQDVPLDEFVRKTFPVEKEVFGLSDFEGENVKQFFVDRGVVFPTGATVRFDDATSRLTVYNTPEALEQIDDLIEQFNVSDPQVLIQVKFVEVEMNDLKELSFEYSFGRPAPTDSEALNAGTYTLLDPTPGNEGVIAESDFAIYYPNMEAAGVRSNVGDAWAQSASLSNVDFQNAPNIVVRQGDTYLIPENGSYYSGMIQNEVQSSYGSHVTWGMNDKLVRTADTESGIFGSSTALQNDVMFQWSAYNANGYQFGAAIHALDQADSTEILSAPRVTTMNNENAVIKMVTEKYYPESWDDAEVETVSTNGNNVPVFTPSIPQFGGATEEGIALQVRPSVEEDNYTIYLEMTPVIQEFVGWTDYSYSIPLGDNNDLYPNTLKMPIIEARLLNTSVMSFDGETVVLGGVVKDELSMIEDQYPILGDIPIIGRLFQAKGKGTKKTNLLIFLTSRLIKPDGTSFRVEQSGRGVPSI